MRKLVAFTLVLMLLAAVLGIFHQVDNHFPHRQWGGHVWGQS